MNRRPRPCPAWLAWCAMPMAAAVALPAAAQIDPPAAITIEVDAAPRAVTLFRGRASVTRPVQLDLARGLYQLVFPSLPETIDPSTLQVRVSGSARVLGVDYEERPTGASVSELAAALDARIDAVKLELREAGDARSVIRAREQFIDAVSVRATSDATTDGGTGALDLERVREQYAFITEARAGLAGEHRALETRERDLRQRLEALEAERTGITGRSPLQRTGVVTLVASSAGRVRIDFVYLVTAATWDPVYSIRAAASGAAVTIEYDAVLTQGTGEDWDDVDLTLSTAQPSLAANPPELPPWYLDVREDGIRPGSPDPRPEFGGAPEAGPGRAGIGGTPLETPAADAVIGGIDPSVSFLLPRQVTVRSQANRQRRTRVAEISARPEYFHVAVPCLTDAVYVRGEMVNAGAYHLLPGRASIFIGQDFVGPTQLESVAPGGRFDLYFGIDRAVRASRLTVNRRTSKTGLLGGGLKTRYDFRIEVENGTGKPIELELWDRIPISRSEQIEVQILNLSWPLASDIDYVEEDRPRGLLKWRLTIPPRTAARPDPFTLSYGLGVTRAKEVAITPLP